MIASYRLLPADGRRIACQAKRENLTKGLMSVKLRSIRVSSRERREETNDHDQWVRAYNFIDFALRAILVLPSDWHLFAGLADYPRVELAPLRSYDSQQ